MSKGTGVESDDLKAKAATERKAIGARAFVNQKLIYIPWEVFELEKTKKRVIGW